MSRIYRYCHSCNWWEWNEDITTPDGRRISSGRCSLISAACINAVTTGSTPPPQYREIQLNEREESHTL